MILKGNDALDKANQLFEYMETSPKVDSFSNVESIHLAHDGKHYGIVKENATYVLKVSDNVNPTIAEDFDYINGVQNKSKYSKTSYNDVVKMFNLMDIEYSRVYGQSLMTEALEEKKYVISAKKKSSDEQPIDDLGSEDIGDLEGDSISPDDEFASNDANEDELGDEPSDSPDDYADVDPDDLDTDDSKKMIQKLSGKLAYELREFDDEDDYSDTAKFAMSMATSALQTDKMSEEDMNAIEKKIDDKFDSPESNKSDSDDEITNEPEDVEELSLEETKSALDNIHMKVGSFAIDEPMMERVVLTKEQFFSALNERFVFESQDPLKTWADNLASMFNSGEISSTMDLLKIIENNIEDHDLEVDFYKLRDSFQKNVTSSKITSKVILDIVDDAMPKIDTDNISENKLNNSVILTKEEFLKSLGGNLLLEQTNDMSPVSSKFSDIDINSLISLLLAYEKESDEEGAYQSPTGKSTDRPWKNNFIAKVKKFIVFFNQQVKRLDRELNDIIRKEIRYGKEFFGGDFNSRKESLINKIHDIDKKFYSLNFYKNNPWMQKMYSNDSNTDDRTGKLLVKKIDDLYNQFNTIESEYLNKLTNNQPDLDENVYFEVNELDGNEDNENLNIYDVEPDELLFDLDEDEDFGDEDILFDIEDSDEEDINLEENYNDSFISQFGKGKKKDIGVYVYGKDLVYGYEWFRKHILNDPMYKSRNDNYPMYVAYHSDRSGEPPFTLNGVKYQYVNAWYPEEDINLEEEVYSEKPKKIKNKTFVQDYFGMDVGRVVGDDDAADYILEDDMEEVSNYMKYKSTGKKQEPRNPFKYK